MKKLILISILLIVGCDEYAPTDHTHTDGIAVTDTLYVYDTLIVNYDTTIFVIDTVYINSIDCDGVEGGTAELDNCNVCDTDKTNDCVPDCAGVWGGDAVEDDCGVCGGEGISEGECDCDGNILDVCGICDGDGSACDTVTDIDGNIYQTIQIGDQLWMSENLKTTHYNNGDEVPYPSNEDWGSYDEGQYGVYDNDPSYADIYGNLYNFAAVDDDRGLCMEGWHVPSDDEWTVLTDYLGGSSGAGGKMKEEGLDHWNYYSDEITEEAINESGFTGLPAGYRYNDGGYYASMGYGGYFWSSSEHEGNDAWYRVLHYDDSIMYRFSNYTRSGFSIRCLRD